LQWNLNRYDGRQGRGRDDHSLTAPRTDPYKRFDAYGSHLGWVARKRARGRNSRHAQGGRCCHGKVLWSTEHTCRCGWRETCLLLCKDAHPRKTFWSRPRR